MEKRELTLDWMAKEGKRFSSQEEAHAYGLGLDKGASNQIVEVKFDYFKESGKWYAEANDIFECSGFYAAIDKIEVLQYQGRLPGLVRGAKEFYIVAEITYILDVNGRLQMATEKRVFPPVKEDS